MDIDKRLFIPGRDKLSKGESLSPDSTAYEMLHTLSTTWPCLSFDIIPDSLGNDRKAYPATLYAVAGTQAESRRARDNEILVMKMSSLSRMERLDGSDSDDDDSSDEASVPILETKSIPMASITNRIRAHQFPSSNSAALPATLTATMTESAHLLIHNISPHLRAFDSPGTIITPQQSHPVATLEVHQQKGSEGYALSWAPLSPTPRLLSGDNEGNIFLHSSVDAEVGKWTTDTRPFRGHEGSVEDIQWSPNENNVFASAGSDGTVRIWDVRSKSRRPAITVKVSDTDVNVLSWSKQTQHLLATGADDGVWAVWDLRQWKPLSTTPTAGSNSSSSSNNSDPKAKPDPVARFNFHKEQITSVEWHPTDDSIVCVAAGDNTMTLWDLAVEFDDEEARGSASAGEGVPPQLLFVHYMEDVKEGHWHPQIPGCVMGTGGAGFG